MADLFAALIALVLVALVAGFVPVTLLWLLRGPLFRVERRFLAADNERVVVLVGLPLVAVYASLVAGFGVNLLTDAGARDRYGDLGAVFVLGSVVVPIAFGYLMLDRLQRPRGAWRTTGLWQRAAALAAVDWRTVAPPSRAGVLRRLDRLDRVGDRLAGDLALRRWLRRRGRALLAGVAATVVLGLLALGAALATWPVRAGEVAVVAMLLLLGPATLLLWWDLDRHRLRSLRAELRAGTRRARERLARAEARETREATTAAALAEAAALASAMDEVRERAAREVAEARAEAARTRIPRPRVPRRIRNLLRDLRSSDT